MKDTDDWNATYQNIIQHVDIKTQLELLKGHFEKAVTQLSKAYSLEMSSEEVKIAKLMDNKHYLNM